MKPRIGVARSVIIPPATEAMKKDAGLCSRMLHDQTKEVFRAVIKAYGVDRAKEIVDELAKGMKKCDC
jgi:hypothetical protein